MILPLLIIALIALGISGCANESMASHRPPNQESTPMVLIPEGPYSRGSAAGAGRKDETPQAQIYVKTFYIDTYEVTNRQYLDFLAATGHREPFNVFGEGPLSQVDGIDNLPVVQVTWNDAEDYCFWVGKRLPTEAEWEKAARGTDGRTYPWGNMAPTSKLANYDRDWDEGAALAPVGSHPDGASPYGVHDMSGNIREWVSDWYAEDYYMNSPDRDPQGPDTGLLKVIRGGSWHSLEHDIRTTARGKGGFALKTHGVGFRCAKDKRK